MSMNSIIQSQYQAALDMLKEAVTRCPEELWDDTAYKNRFWNIAYHALFYTHLYLQTNLEDFSPWEKHRPDSEQMQASNAYNIRHLQHHTGELCERLGRTGAVEIGWIGMKPS